jgi:uncharacterized protein
MKIKLNEIPQEGRSYTFNRESGELTPVLADLVKDHAYKVDVFIRPIGSAYELTGSVKSTTTEVCSRCGWDLEVPIDRKVHELLIDEGEEYRKSHSVQGNQSVDFSADGPSMVSIKGEVFDIGEYAHEAIALAEPLYPSCGDDNCEHLAEVEAKKRELAEEFARVEAETNPGHTAFSVLKDIMIDTKGKGPKKQ